VAQPGDLLVHHAVTVHRPTAIERASSRSLGLIFYAAHARQDAQKLATTRRVSMQSWQERQKI